MKIGFLFCGQGAQYSGMMKDIADRYVESAKVFGVADRILERDISGLCFSASQEELNLTHNTQPCVLAADLAAYEAIKKYDVRPDAVGGFSLGEYAALVAARVLDIADAFSIVQKRADYMQEAVPVGDGAMAAIMKIPSDEVELLCKEVDGYVVPANYNCPGQIVVSGENSAIDKLCNIAKERKIRALKLPVSAPFHCEMMALAAERLRDSLDNIKFNLPDVPVFMNVDGKPDKSPETIREKVVLQAKSPVRWEDTLRNMAEYGIDTFVEIGPGRTLSGFVKKTFKENIRVYNVTDIKSLNEVITSL